MEGSLVILLSNCGNLGFYLMTTFNVQKSQHGVILRITGSTLCLWVMDREQLSAVLRLNAA